MLRKAAMLIVVCSMASVASAQVAMLTQVTGAVKVVVRTLDSFILYW